MWTEDLAQLTPEDLEQLVEDEAPENETREYKQALPSGGDDDRREFLYDVASLANGAGGFLIFGVAEKRDAQNKPTGIAGALMPITVPNISSEVARLENMIRDGLAPRLTGFASKIVAIPDGNALVFSIPRSWNAPHMVTFKQVNKFYSRVSSGKYLMSVDELRRAFSQGNALREAILNWRRHRVKLLQIKQGPVLIDESATMVMHVIPVQRSTHPQSLPHGRSRVTAK